MDNLPFEYQDLISDDIKAFAYLSTIMEDGSPQVTPIWFNYTKDYILINSAKGRVKDRNMRTRTKVALAIQDPKNPYRYIQIHGKVIEVTEDGAKAHIDILAKKYIGRDAYPFSVPGEIRVIYKILPEHVVSHG